MGAGHSHGDRPSLGPAPRRLQVLMALVVGPLVLATLAGLFVLWPDGDLEVSVLDELPKGRKPVKTKIVSESERQRADDLVRAEVQAGRDPDAQLINENHLLDLTDAIRQGAQVQMHMSPLRRPECLGLCPTCGANLDLEQCGCQPPEAESPFAVLRQLNLN